MPLPTNDSPENSDPRRSKAVEFQSITVTATSGLTEDEIKKMVEANKDYMVEVRSGQEFDKARHAAEKALEEIESLFPQVTDIIAGSDFGQDAVKKARAVVDRTRQAIAAISVSLAALSIGTGWPISTGSVIPETIDWRKSAALWLTQQ